MKLKLLVPLFIFALAAPVLAQDNAFLGKWDITATAADGKRIYWLEVKNDGGQLTGWFLNRGGSVFKLPAITIQDGVMANTPNANNLVSKQRFKDFRIHAEYKLETSSNSGIYLRGRYELQVLDDYGKAPESHGHMAIYSRLAPKVNASKPAGEWQTVDATIVGNRLTVVLNGQMVQNNVLIEGITGGALDSDEAADGPIMLQGDHGKVWFRRVTVTPIVK